MHLDLNIGPYKLTKRTEYSKLQVLDEEGINITNTPAGREIIWDYKKQIEHPEDYFEIVDNILCKHINPKEVKYLFVPEYIEKIEQYAFEERNFEYIHLPKNLYFIGEQAFENCTSLKEIDIPDTLDVLEWGIFNQCTNLKKASLPKNLKEVPLFLFNRCYSLSDIIIPDGVIRINESAFNECRTLRSVNIPDTIERFDGGAFEGCTLLKELTLPKNFRSFGPRLLKDSGVETLIFKHNFSRRWFGSYSDYLSDATINKIVIHNTVYDIDHNLFKKIGPNIKKIDFLGTKEQFEHFKSTNKELFTELKRAKIIITDRSLEDKIKPNKTNYIDKIKKIITER